MGIGERIACLSMTAALAALLGAGGAGCGTASRSDYCDDSGCYSCDGYGCRMVGPSARPVDAGCTSDNECGSGAYCSQGACLLDTSPKPNCIDDRGCASQTQRCVEGYCRYLCTNDRQCQQVDARIGICAAGYCHAAAEIGRACTHAADCAPAQSCVDNVCR